MLELGVLMELGLGVWQRPEANQAFGGICTS